MSVHRLTAASNASVLHVEDNATIQAAVRRMASLVGPRVDLVSAGTVAAALAILEVSRPDLVLLDLNLPDGQGDEILRAIRNDQRTRTVPVVIVSSRTSQHVIEHMTALGANGYIVKPFDVEDLLAILRGAVSNHNVDSVGDLP